MNGKISIGQYIPTNSWMHRLDPRVKILGLVFLLAGLFLIPIATELINIIIISSFLVLGFVLSISAKIPIKRVLAGLRPLIFLLTFTFVIQLFVIQEGEALINTKMYISATSILAMILVIVIYNVTKRSMPFRILYFFLAVFLVFFVQWLLPYGKITSYNFIATTEGLKRGLFLFIRIMSTVILTSLLTFTTMTTDLNYGIEYLLKPLKILYVPVEMFAMMMSLILRFIPTLLFETEKIMKAQASRGLDFKESKLKEKITQVIALLVPILLISVNRAEELGDAMDARGYVIGAKRTRIDEYRFTVKDFISLVMTALVLSAVIYFKVAF